MRRSLFLTVFVVGGHCFYYVLVLSANHAFDPIGFGRFYAAWSILNVLVAPNAIVALLLTQHFAEAFRNGGVGAAVQALVWAGALLAPWALAGLAAVQTGLFLGGAAAGIDSLAIILVLPVTAASFLAVEAVRAVFPAILRSAWFGTSWLVWCVVQCAFGLAGLVIFGTPWAVFAGMLAANVVSFAALTWLVAQLGRAAPSSREVVPRLSLVHVVPFCSAYGGFVLLNNADVFLAYLMLNSADLGAYSAAAVLPKAIVTATQPVANIVLPILVSLNNEAARTRQAVVKAITVTGLMATAGASVLYFASDAVCGGHYGMHFCSPDTMLFLAVGAIFLSMVRVSMAADLARGRYGAAHLPLVACPIFLASGLAGQIDMEHLAGRYALAGVVVFAAMAAVKARR